MSEVIPLRTRLHNEILEAQIAVDVFMLLHIRQTPEEHLDMLLAELKKEMLEKFYERFPGQKQ